MKYKKIVANMYQEVAETYFTFRTNKKTGSWFYNEHLEMPTTLKILGNIRKKNWKH